MRKQSGSAMVMALFVLTLLTALGTALLFLGKQETKMSQANLRSKKAFYLAEAALDSGRMTLLEANTDDLFTDDLQAAAGLDGNINFDPATLQVSYDSDGNVTGFSGYGDDTPLRPWSFLGQSDDPGWYVAFLTNDPVEGRTVVNDANSRLMVTGYGAGRGRSLEMVQAIVEPYRFLPPAPPAAITLLGPSPDFDNGNSGAQSHTGNDCGVSGGAFAPIVGTVTGDARDDVQDDMKRPGKFSSGPAPFTGEDTVGDLTDPTDPIVAAAGNGTIDPGWLDCLALKQMVEEMEIWADYYCNADSQSCAIPTTSVGNDDVVFVDGDLANTPNGNFSGVLVVTGELVYNGNTGWDGLVMVVGEGRITRSGGGGGNPSGGVIVANIDPTPGGPRSDKSDWCTASPPFGPSVYHTSGGGNSTVEWCSGKLETANSIRDFKVVEFAQR